MILVPPKHSCLILLAIGVFPCVLMQSSSLPRHLSPFPPQFEVWPGMQNVNKTVTEQKFEHCNQEKKQYIPTSVFSIFSCSSSSVKSPSSNGASLLFLVWPRTLCNPSSLYFLFLSTSVPPPSCTLCEPMSLSAFLFETPFNLSSLSE